MPVPKLRRWIDLLASLLRRHYPVPFEEIIREVPAYQSGTKAARAGVHRPGTSSEAVPRPEAAKNERRLRWSSGPTVAATPSW